MRGGQRTNDYAKALKVLSKRGLVKAMESWVGDVDFLSPPMQETFQNLKSARDTIVGNLKSEGINELPASCSIDKWLNNRDFMHLVFRNYDAFLSNSASLLCQIVNREGGKKNAKMFSKFYRAAYQLKEILSESWREMETDDMRPLQEFWTNQAGEGAMGDSQSNWGQLLNYVRTYETEQFMRHFRPKQAKEHEPGNIPRFLLPLTATGIYKRIRMLCDTLHHQRASAHLDWLTRRFDFLGCRLTCLYKNQVFALYEQIWNQGDPFFLYNTDETKKPERFLASYETHKRTRWLCLRTNVHEDEYRALQIAGLADPSAIEAGHWDRCGYNLRRLKYVLGELFKSYETERGGKLPTLRLQSEWIPHRVSKMVSIGRRKNQAR